MARGRRGVGPHGGGGEVVELVRARTGSDAVALGVRAEHGEVVRLAVCGTLPDESGTGARRRLAGPAGPPPRRRGVLAIDETREDATWPDWSAAAARRGIRSARFVGLASRHGHPMVLELYAGQPHAFDGMGTAVVDAACLAGLALRQVERVADLERDADERALVGQASGLLMERYHLGADRALEYLVRSSERAHLDLNDLARELVAAQDRAVTHTRAPFPAQSERPPDDREGVTGGT